MKLVLSATMVLLVTLASAASSSPSVIIIGAGISGISAAKTLHENNIKEIIILEATNRIGGRIHKSEIGGHTVEKGANWLHGVGGSQKNPIYEIAKLINLNSYFSDFTNLSLNTYNQQGKFYFKEEVEAALEMAKNNEEIGTKFAEMFNADKTKDDDMSVLAFERLNRREPKTALERMIDFYNFDGEQSEAPRVTSLKHILPRPEYTLFGGSSYFVADSRGFESIVHFLAKSFLTYTDHTVTDPRIIFNQVVREVDYSKRGIVTVKTEDGKVYQAKTVILSPSIGVLQTNLITFKPELPIWKRRAIDEFSIGVYTRIFLQFPNKFWPTGNKTEFFFYVHQKRGYYALWQNLENEYPGSNILIVIVMDEESKRIEQQSDEETKEEAMKVLRKIFGDDIPNPTQIMVPRWFSDRFYKGSFTNWPFGYTLQKHHNLRAPVDSLYFTGEHTHPKLFGYVDGAYYAGINTAKEVINCLKRRMCTSTCNEPGLCLS